MNFSTSPNKQPSTASEKAEDYSVRNNVTTVSPQFYRSSEASFGDSYVSKFSSYTSNKDAVVTPDTSHPPNFGLLASTTPSNDRHHELPRNCEPNLQVELLDRELWEEFSSVGTEMIVTKAGRRMFPGYRVKLDGLNPNEQYCVFMDIVNVDQHRYKFQGGEWMVAGKGEQHLPRRMFLHSDSPASGRKWMSDLISFNKIKLTNSNTAQATDKIILNSMHRYQPRVHIVKTSDVTRLEREPMSTFAFPQTVFITVTAYQNGKVTKLKINNNPFAKGFRDNGARTNFHNNKNFPLTKRPKTDKSNNNNTQQTNLGGNHSLQQDTLVPNLPMTSSMTSYATPTSRNNFDTTSNSSDTRKQSEKDFLLHFPRIAKKKPCPTQPLPKVAEKSKIELQSTPYQHYPLPAFSNISYSTSLLDQTVPFSGTQFNISHVGLNPSYPNQAHFLPQLYESYSAPSCFTLPNTTYSKPTTSPLQPNTIHPVYNMLHADTTQYKTNSQIAVNKMYAF